MRADDLVITQPAHAWVSGQLARAWSGEFEPREAVILAAEQHDVGWVEEDLHPRLNPESGRPRSFMEMPLDVHLAIWRGAAARMLAQSRYAALLVSLHGTSLYERRKDVSEVAEYLTGQRALQRELAAGVDEAQLDRNRRLVLAWDHLSLALCLEWEPGVVHAVPGFGDLSRSPGTIRPWPFTAPRVKLVTEALRLPGLFGDEGELRAAFAAAERVPLTLELREADDAPEQLT